MDPAKSFEFAAFLELHEFESPLRDALLRDIRTGGYAPGKLADPWTALHVALGRIDAGSVVMERFARMRPAEEERPELTEDQIARLAAMDVPDFTPPENPDKDKAIDAFIDMMVPGKSKFMAALVSPQ